ncbi:unnamed protein product [Absidia cylindrospora]
MTTAGGTDHHSNMNILRLDTHGMVDYTAASMNGSGTMNDVVGKSLKSLIHADDRQRLVDGLNEQQTTYQVLFLRWLRGDHNSSSSKHDDGTTIEEESSCQWISLTMLTVPKRRSYGGGALYDDTAARRRQLVIIRPATHPHPSVMPPTPTAATTTSSPSLAPMVSSSSSPFIVWSLRGLQVMRIMFGFCLGMIVEGWFTTWEALYQGQRYMVEFLAHLLISVLDFMADCIDPAPSSTSSVRVMSHEELKKQQQNHGDDDDDDQLTEVPWLRPLHRKRWATAVRTLRKHVQSNTVAQKSLGVLESIGVVQSCNMFDYLEKVTSDRSQPPPPPAIKSKHI